MHLATLKWFSDQNRRNLESRVCVQRLHRLYLSCQGVHRQPLRPLDRIHSPTHIHRHTGMRSPLAWCHPLAFQIVDSAVAHGVRMEERQGELRRDRIHLAPPLVDLLAPLAEEAIQLSIVQRPLGEPPGTVI